MPEKRLYRSNDEKMISGVCGGLANYLETDPTWVRLAFVGAFLLGGFPGLIAYAAMSIVVPRQPALPGSDPRQLPPG